MSLSVRPTRKRDCLPIFPLGPQSKTLPCKPPAWVRKPISAGSWEMMRFARFVSSTPAIFPIDSPGRSPSRHTNRRFFSGPSLAAAEKADLEQEVEHVPNVKLTWLDLPTQRREVLRLMRLAETERFRSRTLHAELFSALRFDADPGADCERGIPIGAAEVEMFARPLFGMMRRWSVMRLLNIVRAHSLLGLRAAYLPARLSPHLGVLTSDGDMPHAAISAGRALERFWLRTTQLGMALQPFAAAPLYARSEFTGVSERTRATLRAGWAELVPRRIPLMAFRLGHADAPSARTGRPPLSYFLEP